MPETKQKAKPEKPTVAEVWTEIGKESIDQITQRRTYEPWEKPTVGCRFYRFKKRGDTIEGKLSKGIKNFRQPTSYPLKLDSGEIVEIVGNRILHALIQRGELVGQRVRITFIGSEATFAGHYRKVYRVFKVKY